MTEQTAAPLRLFFMRHGETEWALSGQHTGRTDIPLTAHGEVQARALAPLLAAVSFNHVFSSPRQRAQHTAQLAGLGAQVVVEPSLAEWDYGDYEGLRSAEIKQQRPGWSIWRDGCPNGESVQDVTTRVDQLIERLRQLHGNVALFAHGHLGAALATRWINLELAAGQHFELHPASLSILSYARNHAEIPVISQWNVSPAL